MEEELRSVPADPADIPLKGTKKGITIGSSYFYFSNLHCSLTDPTAHSSKQLETTGKVDHGTQKVSRGTSVDGEHPPVSVSPYVKGLQIFQEKKTIPSRPSLHTVCRLFRSQS